MSDREYLERTEAREMLSNYNIQTANSGKKVAADWLNKRINHLEKLYGHGFSKRVRGYMREYDDESNRNESTPKIQLASDRGRENE